MGCYILSIFSLIVGFCRALSEFYEYDAIELKTNTNSLLLKTDFQPFIQPAGSGILHPQKSKARNDCDHESAMT